MRMIPSSQSRSLLGHDLPPDPAGGGHLPRGFQGSGLRRHLEVGLLGGGGGQETDASSDHQGHHLGGIREAEMKTHVTCGGAVG